MARPDAIHPHRGVADCSPPVLSPRTIAVDRRKIIRAVEFDHTTLRHQVIDGQLFSVSDEFGLVTFPVCASATSRKHSNPPTPQQHQHDHADDDNRSPLHWTIGQRLTAFVMRRAERKPRCFSLMGHAQLLHHRQHVPPTPGVFSLIA